jgi:hypothetical protein
LLAGAAGALGLLAGETILNATPAQAGTDGDVVLGAHNTTVGYTWIDTRADPYVGDPALLVSASVDNTQSALYVFNDTPQGSTPGPAIWARSAAEGLYGSSGSSPASPGTRNGVYGTTDSPADSGVWGEAVAGGYGVSGSTNTNGLSYPAGVYGANLGSGPGVKATSSGGAAVYGLGSANSEGVYAQSGVSQGTSPGATRNGVHGVTDSPADSGVWGEAVGGGYGVSGSTNTMGHSYPAGVYGANLGSGPGVKGYALNGTGVYGLAGPNGVAVAATNSGDGTALQVIGRAAFTRAGSVTITAPATTATVTPPGGLAGTLVLALLQTAAPGIWVTAAVPDASTGKITIYLNAAPSNPASVHVAWFVLN